MQIEDDPELQNNFGQGYLAFMKGVPFEYCPYDLQEKSGHYIIDLPFYAVEDLIRFLEIKPSLDKSWQDWRNGWLYALGSHRHLMNG